MLCQTSQYNGIQVIHLLPKACTKCEAVKKRRAQFIKQLEPHIETYGKDTMNAFYKYWAELNRSGTKMRYELEKTWELPKRLQRWESNQKFESKSKSGFPNHYDTNYLKTIDQTKAVLYIQYLKSLGFKEVKTQEGVTINYVK